MSLRTQGGAVRYRVAVAEAWAERWFMLATLFLARAAMGFQFQSVGASAPSLTEQFSLNPAQIGTLIGLYMLPGVVIAVPGSLLARRFGEKSTCLLGLALMVLGGLLSAASDAQYGVAAGRIISGAGAVIFNLVLTNMVVSWFAGREVVTALAVILACWPLSIGAALISETALGLEYGWHVVMLGTAFLSGLAFVLVAALYHAPPAAPAAAAASSRHRRETLPVSGIAACWTAGLLWGSFNAGLVVFYSFTPLMLTEHGWGLIQAGSLTSVGLWVSVVSLPLGGWVADVLRRPAAAIVLSCGMAGIAMLMLSTAAWPWGSSMLLGAAIGPAAGVILALPSRAVAAANRVVGYGIFYTAYYVLMAAGPGLAGWGQKACGTAVMAVVIGGAFFLSGIPLLALFGAFLQPRCAKT